MTPLDVRADSRAHTGQSAGTGPKARVLFLGDSLTAGYGLAASEAYPSLLAEDLPIEAVNAGVSGDTSAGALARLGWILGGDESYDIAVVALGANDMLRGLPVPAMRDNLSAIIKTLQAQDIRVILAGMRASPGMGTDYQQAFDAVYPALASQYDVVLVPFLLQGVAGIPQLNQSDGIHPTAEGARRIADTLHPVLQEAIDQL